MRLSIIIPTCGRPTLKDTLFSIAGQLKPDDEVLVVGDGAQPEAAAITKNFLFADYCETPTATHNLGASQRDLAQGKVKGDYVMFMDDDDIYTPDALKHVRDGIAQHPHKTLVFRMEYPGHNKILWAMPELLPGNIGTPMFIVPTSIRLPRWESFQNVTVHDFYYLDSVAKRSELVWLEPIIAHIH